MLLLKNCTQSRSQLRHAKKCGEHDHDETTPPIMTGSSTIPQAVGIINHSNTEPAVRCQKVRSINYKMLPDPTVTVRAVRLRRKTPCKTSEMNTEQLFSLTVATTII